MTSKTNQKFGKLFAKKKKQTTKVKLVDDHDEKESELETPAKVDVNANPDQPKQISKQIQNQESADAAVADAAVAAAAATAVPLPPPQPEKKQKKGPNFNWFDDDQDSDEQQIPEAGLDLIKDQKQIQSQKKKQEANKKGQEYWDHEAIQGAQSLVQKRNNQLIEKERIKKQQSELLKNAKSTEEVFAAYNMQFFNGVKHNQNKNVGMKLEDDEFISLEEQTQMAKIGKKKAAALNTAAKASTQNADTAQQATKTIKSQQSKYKNQFRDLGGDRDSDDEQNNKKQKKKFIIGDKKPGQDFQKKSYKEEDKGWKKGTGQIESQSQEKKQTSKNQDNGFKLGGGIIQKPKFQSRQKKDSQVTFSRQAFGSGQIEQQHERPFKKRQFEGRQNGMSKGFNRQKFGTGKIQLKQQKPRQYTKHMNGGDERRSKNDGWSKGGGVQKKGGFNFRDNKKIQKQEASNTKQVHAQSQAKAPIKKQSNVLENENKDENCWDLDL